MMLGLKWFLGLFQPAFYWGGDSTSSNQQTTNNVDRRQVVDSSGVGISSDSSSITFNSMDNGAVNAAIELAKSSNSNDATNYQKLLEATLQIEQQQAAMIKANTDLAGQLSGTAQTAYSDAASQASGQKNLILAAMAVVGIVAFKSFGKK